MIPKIIHYCWFGPKPLPSKARKCIDSWKKYFPDYEFKFWNEQNSPIAVPFAEAAMRQKKYAFVADYVRTWALYEYGGIYFDTDVLVVRKFGDEILDCDVFMGYEQPERLYMNVAVWGACAKSSFLKTILEKYCTISFDNNKIFEYTIPLLVTEGYKKYSGNEIVRVFEYDYFYPFPQKQRKRGNYQKYVTKNTYAVHLWDFSWLTTYERIKIRIKKFACLLHIIHKK